MFQVATDYVSGGVQKNNLKEHRDELILKIGEGTLIEKQRAGGSIKKRPVDVQIHVTISSVEKRADVEVTTLRNTMVEREPSNSSADKEQHSPMPESEIAEMNS